MLEAENIAKDPKVKGYTDLDEMFADLKNEKDKIDSKVHHAVPKRL